MRRWLSRSLWLAAWSFWLWLGFGLYRELPRELGPVVCNLEPAEKEEFLGFLENDREIVSIKRIAKRKPIAVLIRNAATGALLRKMEGPVELGHRQAFSFLARHSKLVAEQRPAIPGQPEPKGPWPSVLDLRTETWTDLPVDDDAKRVFHRSKPWAAFYFGGGENDPDVEVVDLSTAKTVFSWTRAKDSLLKLYCEPIFVGNDLIAIPIHRPWDGEDIVDERLEIWSINKGKRIKEIRGVAVGDDPQGSSIGRIAWHEATEPFGGAYVFDLSAEKLVFCNPPNGKRFEGGLSGHDYGVVLSDDGKFLFRLELNKLFDVETGRELWEAVEVAESWPFKKEEMIYAINSQGTFSFFETWHPRLGESKFSTVAVRNFSNGKVLFRYWVPNSFGAHFVNRTETLAFNAVDNTIRTWPPRVNFPLLALCQTILALPLVLLWAALRWRRKRRLAN